MPKEGVLQIGVVIASAIAAPSVEPAIVELPGVTEEMQSVRVRGTLLSQKLELAEVGPERRILFDRLHCHGRQLIVEIRFGEVDVAQIVIDKVLAHLMELLLALNAEQNDRWMVGKGTKAECVGCFNAGMTGLDCLLFGSEILPNEDVNEVMGSRLILDADLRFRLLVHGFLLCESFWPKLASAL